jgi:molecular chaperone GrpE
VSAAPDQWPGAGPDTGTAPGPDEGTDDGPDDAAAAVGAAADERAEDDAAGDGTYDTAPDHTAEGAVGDEAEAPEGSEPATDVGNGDGSVAVGPVDAEQPDGADPTDSDPAEPAGEGTFSVEDLVHDLERVTAERDQVSVERDQYLDTSRRLQAEFENYRKQVAKREVETRERAAESLVSELLPVLDACDGALASGASDVEPVRAALVDALTKKGLDRIGAAEEPFDPSKHDAVLHEPGETEDGPVVAEVMRAGYSWNGRVVRPAMVRVRGG